MSSLKKKERKMYYPNWEVHACQDKQVCNFAGQNKTWKRKAFVAKLRLLKVMTEKKKKKTVN